MKPLAAQLHEVHEWLGFAIEPKKVELCARMRALVDSTEDADTLAVKIKALQEEWKQLGALPDAREQALWLEFKAAADEAWKPCKAAFAQRAGLHRRNLEARMQPAQLPHMNKDGLPEELRGGQADEVSEPAGSAGSDHRPGAAPDWRRVQKPRQARAAFAETPVDQTGERKSQKAGRSATHLPPCPAGIRAQYHRRHRYRRANCRLSDFHLAIERYNSSVNGKGHHTRGGGSQIVEGISRCAMRFLPA
jgi:hypothetical protein